ncbi:MAG: riboflavin kinase, partial [Elusimicrobiota bacterium]|nr:riboflavin kinase [Elusimicrobiota bacterium]
EKHKLVPEGVFAAEVICKAGRFPAVVNAGSAPTFGIKKVFEFHAIGDGAAALVAKCGRFTVNFGAFIRKSRKFATREALIERIKKDIEIARRG